MGSNKSNTNSSMGSAWRAVQNGSNSSTYGNDEDDASGMAWVKKRRAEKARLAAEKKDQEKGDANADAESLQPAITEEVEQETPRLPKEDNIRGGVDTPIDAPTVAPAEQLHEQQKHVTTAVNLPPQRLHKRDSSVGHRIPVPQAENPIKEKPSFGVDVFDVDIGERSKVTPDTETSTGSTSEDEVDEDEDSTSDDDEDDSDASFEVCVPPISVRD